MTNEERQELERLRRENDHLNELVSALRKGQPIGPLIGAMALAESEREAQALRRENEELRAKPDACGLHCDRAEAAEATVTWWTW